MNVLDVLKKIFVAPIAGTINSLWVNVRGDMSRLRSKTEAKHNKNRAVSLAACDETLGKFKWRLVGMSGKLTCRANTKSEARARFKTELQEAETLKFLPQRITRLPIGCEVHKVA